MVKVILMVLVLTGCAVLPETNPMVGGPAISMRTGKLVRADEAYIDYREYNKKAFDENGNMKPEYVNADGTAKNLNEMETLGK
jgi:hypothetical protein